MSTAASARKPRPRGAPPPWFKPVLFVLLSLPLAWLALRWALLLAGEDVRSLSAEPIDYSIEYLGLWSIRMLLLALAITPIQRLTGWGAIMSVRRMVGLFAFTYVCCHLLMFFGMDLLFSLELLWEEVVKRYYILFGMAAFVCLVPLAITSTRGWQKRLGGRRWQRLHRLVYAAGVFAVVHYLLLVKGNQYDPWIYIAVLIVLFAVRLLPRRARGYLPAFAR